MKEKKKVKMEAIEEWIHKYLAYFFVDVRLVARLYWCSFWKMVIFFMIRISFLILFFIFILIKTIKIKKFT